MAKEEALKFEGKVIEVLPNGTFKVTLDNGCTIIAHLGGKLRQNNIRVLLGDSVVCEVSVYDLTKGRITYRNR